MNETETPQAPEPWVELAELTGQGSQEDVQTYLEQLPAGDVSLAVSRLPQEEQVHLLDMLPAESAAELIDQLPDFQAAEIIERLEPQTAASILDQLPSNEMADLLGDLHQPEAEAILEVMAPAEAAEAKSLSQYADDVAGGLMVTEFLKYKENRTAGDVIQDLRSRAEEYRDYEVQYAYVCTAAGVLTGVLRLRDLLLADAETAVGALMIRDPLSVIDDTSLEDLSALFERHHFIGVPVVDAGGKLVGVVHKEAVEEAWTERHDSDYLKSQGIVGGEEIRSMPLLRRSRRRLAWLSVNILLNIVAASVIALFQDTLQAVIALAVFLPMISDMSGCSGNQAVAVSMRELTLGLVRPHEFLRVWLKEASVGLINGVVLGTLIGVVAWVWQSNGYLGFVVGIALCLNTIVAVSIGGLIPLVLKRMKVDPAVASGPILTTVTDMCGFFFALGTAAMLIEQLKS